MKTKKITKDVKSYDTLVGIYLGYIKMVEVLTAKNTIQLRSIQLRSIKKHTGTHKSLNSKEYTIT